MLAVEHAVPRGTQVIVVLAAPGFNTYGTNLASKRDTIEVLQGLIGELQRDLAGG